jgi:hypothetical protein
MQRKKSDLAFSDRTLTLTALLHLTIKFRL